MLKLPDDFRNKQTSKINKKRIYLVEYTAANDTILNEVVLNESAIVYVAKGTKEVRVNGTCTTISAGQLFLAAKGSYLMSEYLPADGNFESVMLFINAYQAEEVLHIIKTSQQFDQQNTSLVHVLDSSKQLMLFFQSLTEASGGLLNEFKKHLLELKVKELIFILLSDLKSAPMIKDFIARTISKRHVSISKVVKSNLYNPISLEALAQNCNMSVSTFQREFEKEFHSSPVQWMMNRRLEKALHLIKTTDDSITDIALICGFESYVHFSRRFKTKYGQSATSIRSGRMRQEDE